MIDTGSPVSFIRHDVLENLVIMYKNGLPSDDLDLDIYCLGQDSEQHSEDFSCRSLFVKKLLTKEIRKI